MIGNSGYITMIRIITEYVKKDNELTSLSAQKNPPEFYTQLKQNTLSDKHKLRYFFAVVFAEDLHILITLLFYNFIGA